MAKLAGALRGTFAFVREILSAAKRERPPAVPNLRKRGLSWSDGHEDRRLITLKYRGPRPGQYASVGRDRPRHGPPTGARPAHDEFLQNP